jgi:ribosomal protein S18 acetylase RimI-like enzyme
MLGLDRIPAFQTDEPERVGSIVCFVIASPYRRHGVARRLLDAACESLARQGFAVAEAYPTKQSGPDPMEHRGPLRMYLDAGFTPFRDTPRITAVRRDLSRI